MPHTPNGKKQLRVWCTIALLFWCVLISVFLYLFEKNGFQSTVLAGKEIGRSTLKKDYTYRVWAAMHGGVYVPTTDQTQPNLFLSHIPDRDITTLKGKELTLINPAYMTRQVFDLEKELYGHPGHLTSLNAIRPANKPDQWERVALNQFEQGVKEVAEFMTVDDLPFVRVMIPMETQAKCLKCHEAQGYKVGDIRGGISVTVPMKDIFTTAQNHAFTDRLYYFVIFLIGLAGLLVFYLQSSKQLSRRFKAEKDLTIQGNHLKGIVDNISNGIAVYDVLGDGDDFIIKSINSSGLKNTHSNLKDVKGKSVTEVFPGIIELGLFAAFQRVWKTGKPEHVPFSNYNDERISLWVENYIYKLPTGEIVAVYDDITARKQAEETILLKTDEWEKTFDAIPDIITLQNRDMVIIRANQAAFDFFQMEPKELLGNTCHQLFRGTSKPCTGCPGVSSFCDSKNHSSIIEHISLDTIFRVNSAPILNRNNDVQYFVFIAQDITETRRLEDELFQAHKMEAIGTLAGGIAHDFNNILSAILGYAELAQTTIPADNPASKDIDEVMAAGLRATELVKQILTFSRKTDQQKQPLKPHLIVKEALKLMRSSLPSTIDIQSTIDQERCLVLANPTSIHQIVVNLCTNALHAIGENKGILKVRLQRVLVGPAQIPAIANSKAGLFVKLSVEDSGQGMDEKTVTRIFEPYFTTKKEGEGTGLGLAVTHTIVHDCNGFIEVESTSGKGTSIHIYLPAIKGNDTTRPNDIEKQMLPTGTETILVIDDEPSITDITQSFLSSLGYTVVTENNSLEALRKFEAAPESFDMIITDQTMPDLTGTELAKAILKLKPEIPIILSSGYSTSLTADAVSKSGIKSFVTKPINKRELAEIVRSALDTNL